MGDIYKLHGFKRRNQIKLKPGTIYYLTTFRDICTVPVVLHIFTNKYYTKTNGAHWDIQLRQAFFMETSCYKSSSHG